MSHAFDYAWAVLKAEPFNLDWPTYEEQGIPQPGRGPGSWWPDSDPRFGIVQDDGQHTELPQLGGIARLAGQKRGSRGLRGMMEDAHSKFGEVTGMDTPRYRFRDVERAPHPTSAYADDYQGERLDQPPETAFNPSLNTASTTGLNQAEMQQRQQLQQEQQQRQQRQQQQQQQQQMMQSTPNPMQWAM